jgi:hypothetical protein
MLSVYCPTHGREVLLTPRRIDRVVNTSGGIVVRWSCWCGTTGHLLTGARSWWGAPAWEPTASSGPVEDRPVPEGTAESAATVEEVGEQPATFVGPDAGDDIGLVVEAGVGSKVVERTAGTGLGVGRTEHDPVHPGRQERTGAHGAGLQGDDQGASAQPPAPGAVGRVA